MQSQINEYLIPAFGGFRRANASMMDELAVPMKVRQQRLGHSYPRLTMDVYTHGERR